MDQKLISWARAVNARRRVTGGVAAKHRLPALWLFSDRERLADPAAVLRRLPKGLCGLVLRGGGGMTPAALRQTLALCRERRIPVVVAGSARYHGLPLPAGLPIGRHFSRSKPIKRQATGLVTASAHNQRELMRAMRGGADGVFLSPAFATASHPGAAALGPLRWSALATRSPVPVLALGGITGASVCRLARASCCGAGAIGSLV